MARSLEEQNENGWSHSALSKVSPSRKFSILLFVEGRSQQTSPLSHWLKVGPSLSDSFVEGWFRNKIFHYRWLNVTFSLFGTFNVLPIAFSLFGTFKVLPIAKQIGNRSLKL